MHQIVLPPASQRLLLRVSRSTLEGFVRGSDRRLEGVDDPHLQSTRYGAFVSLHADGHLRGCIGNCAPEASLLDTVIEMTEAAASRDHRMDPVRLVELDAIRIDISVLSPLEPTPTPLALEVGKHGLHVAADGRRGVLLPQVATQFGWDIETFLEQTCRKAGLNPQAWRDPTVMVSSFTALVIEEER